MQSPVRARKSRGRLRGNLALGGTIRFDNAGAVELAGKTIVDGGVSVSGAG